MARAHCRAPVTATADQESAGLRKAPGAGRVGPKAALQVTVSPSARGATTAACERRCTPSGGVAPRSHMPDMLVSSRPASRAPRRSRWDAGFHHGPLDPDAAPEAAVSGCQIAAVGSSAPCCSGPHPGSSHAASSAAAAQAAGSAAARRATHSTSGPSRKAAVSPSAIRLAPSRGENTTAIISSEGTLSVADPCTSASDPSMPSPRRCMALDTGTTQAEHRFTTGPMPSPLRMRPQRPPSSRGGAVAPVAPVAGAGIRKVSAMPPARNANTMPAATSCR